MGASNLQKIPSVSELLQQVRNESWSVEYTREQLVSAIRKQLVETRKRMQKGDSYAIDLDELTAQIENRLRELHSYSLKKVINATGIIVHTNLGRSPLSAAAVARLSEIAGSYSNLEFDLDSGLRGSRDKHLEKLVLSLLPVEAALIVNNNAAALLLILNTLAEGREVIVSRGELVEIGGSFRLPEIMQKSGAILREVGTTNKTKLEDYANALSENTGLILVVHPSNFQITGFTEKPSLSKIAELGQKRGVPVAEDHGSGVLSNLEPLGIGHEPTVKERLGEGPDLICFSGDKILGGPQAGFVCGKKILVDRLHRNPLFRALRVDKMTYAAMEATLLSYLREKPSEIPVMSMLSQTAAELQSRASQWLETLQAKFPQVTWSVETTENFIGGGVAPMKSLPSSAVCLRNAAISADEIATRLRNSIPPVIARIDQDRVLLELRTISIVEQELITSALARILG